MTYEPLAAEADGARAMTPMAMPTSHNAARCLDPVADDASVEGLRLEIEEIGAVM
jgi:hypothetical protein